MKNFEKYEPEIKEAIKCNNLVSLLSKSMDEEFSTVGLYGAID